VGIVAAGVHHPLLVVGCASFKNTPQQDATHARFAECRAETNSNARLQQVYPDGGFTWLKGSDTYDNGMKDCMVRKGQKFAWVITPTGATGASSDKSMSIAQPPRGSTNSPTPVTTGALSGPIALPVWHVGDEWQYAYKSPSDSGTYVWVVNRVETLDGVEHYVVKGGTRELFYRVSDLASSFERVDGVVVNRNTPPRLSYVWPLTVGKVWDQDFQNELPVDRQTTTRNSTWTVAAEETVTVPAGTFRTLKITWRNRNTSALLYEMWYAPDVKQWVKIREVLTNGVRDRELVSFKLK
jgi:hypothetical protein